LAFYTRKLLFYVCKLLFYTRNLLFYTCKLEEVWNSNILIYFWGHVVDGSINFFNRSPLTLTLKFGAEKKRESRERERESERARARESKLLFLRSQVVVVLHS
jgi:hypothetical protein